MCPQTVDHAAMREMKEVILPAAKPPNIIAERVSEDGTLIPAKVIPGRTIAGTLPMKDIEMQDLPRIVYLHPRKAYRRMYLPVDGHGNKEWQWVPNEAKTLTVKTEEELAAAKKQGYQLKHYVIPPMPTTDPDPAAEEETEQKEKTA